MKRQLRAKGAEETGFDEPTPSIAALIDVTFLLLIFFVATTTILKRERDLTMGVPTEGPEVEVEAIVVGVENDGSIVLNPGVGQLLVSGNPEERELIVLENHVEMVRSVAAERDVVVQLRVGEEATQQRVVDVLNCFAKLGVTTVGLVD